MARQYFAYQREDETQAWLRRTEAALGEYLAAYGAEHQKETPGHQSIKKKQQKIQKES